MFTRLAVMLALAGALLTSSALPSRADTASDIKALQAAVKTLQGQVSTLQSQNTSLQSQVNSLKSVTKGLSRVTDTTRTDGLKGTELYITGMNLHVVNGLGATNGDPKSTGTTHVNGLGNVIIGYNQMRGNGSDNRTGSHNLVLGDYQDYSSYGGMVAGIFNNISGTYASVGGGYYNTASSTYASVGGGFGNLASGQTSSVSGGYFNTASGYSSSVSGGDGNTAGAYASSVSGGLDRSATGGYNWAAGGYSQSQ